MPLSNPSAVSAAFPQLHASVPPKVVLVCGLSEVWTAGVIERLRTALAGQAEVQVVPSPDALPEELSRDLGRWAVPPELPALALTCARDPLSEPAYRQLDRTPFRNGPRPGRRFRR